MKFKNNYSVRESRGEVLSPVSATVPGQAVGIVEILARHDLGGNITQDGRLIYPEEELEEFVFPMDVDLTDVDSIRETVKALENRQKELQEKEANEKKAKAIQEKEELERLRQEKKQKSGEAANS